MAGVPQDIAGQLHRVVPAEILEIDEPQPPVPETDRVVEPQIRGREGPLAGREGRARVDPSAFELAPESNQERYEPGRAVGDRIQALEPPLDLGQQVGVTEDRLDRRR